MMTGLRCSFLNSATFLEYIKKDLLGKAVPFFWGGGSLPLAPASSGALPRLPTTTDKGLMVTRRAPCGGLRYPLG